MKKTNLKMYINKKRILTNVVDAFIFIPWIFPLLPIIMGEIININIDNFLVFLLPLLFIIYFGFFVKITHGYTLGGLITKTRIINISDYQLSTIGYTKRVLSGIWSVVQTFISGDKKMNGIGQYTYDEKYHTTVLPNDISIDSLNKNITYKYHFFYDIYWFYLKYSFGFIIILGLFISLIKKLISVMN